ncbi:MAG: AbrB/MazE/SpoVT family DNA-binding domain-containing protein [Spirochaetaceae bacterium]|nr:MAG: AbrB/MazE/SpoVT family DNA-binding domain-containing protein [Spirochaetaceae bacterium]
MKFTLAITDRGTITLPSRLRKEMGIGADSLLIAETTNEGILLRPAVVLPVEVYSADQLNEFAASEKELDSWYDSSST